MSSTLVVAVDMFILFKDCNFLADGYNTFLFFSLLAFVSCVWELHVLGAGVFLLSLKTLFMNMAPEDFLLRARLHETRSELKPV